MEWRVAALLVEAALLVAVVLLLLARGRRSAAAWTLSGMSLAFGVYVACVAWRYAWPRDFADIRPVLAVATILVPTLGLGFVAAFPPRPWTRLRQALYLLAVLPGLAFLSIFLLRPEWWSFGRPAVSLFGVYHALANITATVVFGWLWLRAPDGPFRRQMAYVLGAFLFWDVNDGLLGLAAAPLVPRLMELGALAAAGGIGVIAALRAWSGERRDAGVAAAVVAAFALGMLQFIWSEATVHLLADAAIAPVLVYGFAKYQLLDVDLRLKTGVSRMVAAGFGLLALVVVEEALEGLVSGAFGVLAGFGVAVVVTFLGPVRRLGVQVGERLLPRVRATRAYLDERRIELYRAAVEGTLLDGLIDVRESAALQALRQHLGVTDDEHDSVTRQALALLAPDRRAGAASA